MVTLESDYLMFTCEFYKAKIMIKSIQTAFLINFLIKAQLSILITTRTRDRKRKGQIKKIKFGR